MDAIRFPGRTLYLLVGHASGSDRLISDIIEEDLRSLEEMTAELSKQANRYRESRDRYHQQASVLAEKRNKLQQRAGELSSEATVYRSKRDECNLAAKEAKQKRQEFNDMAAEIKARGGLGDAGDARAKAQENHQIVVKMSAEGQANHEKMCQLMDEASKLREQAQVCHEQFLDCKAAADSEHQKFVEVLKKIDELKNNLPERAIGKVSGGLRISRHPCTGPHILSFRAAKSSVLDRVHRIPVFQHAHYGAAGNACLNGYLNAGSASAIQLVYPFSYASIDLRSLLGNLMPDFLPLRIPILAAAFGTLPRAVRIE